MNTKTEAARKFSLSNRSVTKAIEFFLLIAILANLLFPVMGLQTIVPISTFGQISYNNVKFFSNFDDGTANEWYADGGGGIYGQETGGQLIIQSSAPVHSANFAGKFLVPNPSTGGQIKLFRWRGIDLVQGYYSAWYWFPKDFAVKGWVNIMQWKEKNDPWDHEIAILAKENPNQFGVFVHFADQSTYMARCWGEKSLIPAEKWVKLTVFIKVDSTLGEIKVWADDILIFNQSDLETKGNSDTIQFGVGNYPWTGEQPNLYFYIDDACASSSYV